MNESLQDLIDKSINGIATEAEAQALEERLLADESARDHYLNCVNLHSSMVRRFASANKVPAVEVIPAVRKRRIRTLAIAAGVMLMLGLIAILNRPSTQQKVPIAAISQVVGAWNESGSAFAIGEPINAGHLKILKGLVKLDFSNGAQLTLEGPANLEVTNNSTVVLHSGVVTASIPESAIGFTIDTATAKVVDLGTAFGVSVGADGMTDVCVFQGEVEVSATDTGTKPAQLVREGEAVRTTSNNKNVASVSYQTSQFENAWPLSSGVLQTTGNMRFVTPGPNFHPGNFKDNENIVVFPERKEIIPSQTIRVDLIDPGEYTRSRYDEKPTLASGKKLASYLLQLDAYPEGKNPNRRRGIRGQITFANPIAGVITMNRLLQESEKIFGIQDVAYPSSRTIEPRPEGDLRKGFDSLILAADRRTLFIELQENPGHLDQVRVLVEVD